jgi:hypothetical protein
MQEMFKAEDGAPQERPEPQVYAETIRLLEAAAKRVGMLIDSRPA